MSYDITLYRVGPEADLRAIAETDDPGPGEPDPRPIQNIDPGLRKRLTDEVRRALPDAQEFEQPDGTELTDDRTGIQMTVCSRGAAVSLTFGPTDAPGDLVLASLGRVLTALRETGGLRAYDPQIGKEHTGGAEDLRETAEILGTVGDRPAHKPWWKFW